MPLRARIAERLGQSGPTVSPDGGPDGARRAAHRRGRPAPGAQRARPGPGDPGDAQAPAGRVPARAGHRSRLGAGARGGLPLGARDVRDGRAPAARRARPPDACRRTATRSPVSRSWARTTAARTRSTASRGWSRLDRVSVDAGAASWSAGWPSRCRATPHSCRGCAGPAYGLASRSPWRRRRAGCSSGSGGETTEISAEVASHVFVDSTVKGSSGMRSITVHQLKDVLAQGERAGRRRPGALRVRRGPRAGRPTGAAETRCPRWWATLPTDQPVYLVCAVGARSAQAAAWSGASTASTRSTSTAAPRNGSPRATRSSADAPTRPSTAPGFESVATRPVAFGVASPDPPAWRTCGRRILPRTRSRSIQTPGRSGGPTIRGPSGVLGVKSLRSADRDGRASSARTRQLTS